MYRKEEQPLPPPEKFELPFEGKLSPNNRWVIMAELIPWDDFEEEYAKLFSAEKGAPAKLFRMALGTLIIKEKLGTSDRETIEQIRENPYLQYFIGLNCYQQEPPLESSMLVHFRKRIDGELINKINKKIVKREIDKSDKEVKKKDCLQEKGEKIKNKGKLILDATCAPADIKYPTDLGILNQARIETERIIDNLYKPLRVKLRKKPRTSRKIARKEYLKVAKKRKVSYQERRKAIGKQLKYLKKNLGNIEDLIQAGASLENLSKRQKNCLETIKKVYEQQQSMWENKTQSVPQRIVSLTQPHIRPIVRGKAGKPIEFGAKLSVSCVDNYVFLDKISWENFNESCHLKEQVEKYKETFGYYPESVHVDKVYRNIDHRLTGKEEGLMAYYPLNGDASDSTSNKNHGTIHGGTWTQENLEFLEPLKGTEKPANVDREQNPQSVLNFDGQDDYIEIQEPFENNRYFTISLWINPAILNSNFRGFIGKQEEAYRQPGMWVGPSGNELHYDSYDTSGQRYFSILNNFFESKDKWVHIAWVKENTEYKIYRNGELFAMEPAPTNFYTTNTNYWLGRVDNFFQGKITEVRIWNKARTQDEITQDMNHRLTGKEEGLMAYYPLNGDASDSTSNNNHGTIHGGTWTQENLEFLEPLKTNI